MWHKRPIARTVTCLLPCKARETPDSLLKEETPDSVEFPGMSRTAQPCQSNRNRRLVFLRMSFRYGTLWWCCSWISSWHYCKATCWWMVYMGKHTAGTARFHQLFQRTLAKTLWLRLLCTKAVDTFNPNERIRTFWSQLIDVVSLLWWLIRIW